MNNSHPDKSDWVLNFSEPSDEAMARLKEIVGQLSVRPNTTELPVFIDEGILTVSGTVGDCMIRLHKILMDEFYENLRESKDNGWRFDFVAMTNSSDVASIRILVRLFSDIEPGNIFYGGAISRISKYQFRLTWDN